MLFIIQIKIVLQKSIINYLRVSQSFFIKKMQTKLPEVYQQNNLMTQMFKLFQDKKIMFSAPIFCQDGKFYEIKKFSGKPIFEKDRQIYSMMRGMSNTLITSESNLKSEKDTFKVDYARGDKDIQKMYHSLGNKQKQNVYVITDMKKEEVSPYINSDLYNLMGPQNLKKHEKVALKTVLEDLSCDNKLTPIVIECVPTVVNKYLQEANSSNDKNLIELVYFACFEGKMKKQCIGDQFCFQQSYFKKVWESEKFDVKDESQSMGKLYFIVYEKKE